MTNQHIRSDTSKETMEDPRYLEFAKRSPIMKKALERNELEIPRVPRYLSSTSDVVFSFTFPIISTIILFPIDTIKNRTMLFLYPSGKSIEAEQEAFKQYLDKFKSKSYHFKGVIPAITSVIFGTEIHQILDQTDMFKGIVLEGLIRTFFDCMKLRAQLLQTNVKMYYLNLPYAMIATIMRVSTYNYIFYYLIREFPRKETGWWQIFGITTLATTLSHPFDHIFNNIVVATNQSANPLKVLFDMWKKYGIYHFRRGLIYHIFLNFTIIGFFSLKDQSRYLFDRVHRSIKSYYH